MWAPRRWASGLQGCERGDSWRVSAPPHWRSFVTAAPGQAGTRGDVGFVGKRWASTWPWSGGMARPDCHGEEACCVPVPPTPGSWPQRKLKGTAFGGRNRKTAPGLCPPPQSPRAGDTCLLSRPRLRVCSLCGKVTRIPPRWGHGLPPDSPHPGPLQRPPSRSSSKWVPRPRLAPPVALLKVSQTESLLWKRGACHYPSENL